MLTLKETKTRGIFPLVVLALLSKWKEDEARRLFLLVS